MPDEVYERYRNRSHRELYAMLTAGVPEQVEQLATVWRSMETTASGLSAALRADLNRLREDWDSAAGREFDRRVGLIATFAQTLAEEYAAIHTGLAAMVSALADAKRKAEDPEATDDHESAATQGTAGASAGALLGPLGALIGGVVGGTMGHGRDEAERERARERMVMLVADLAALYRVTDYRTWPVTVPTAPPEIPHGGTGAGVDVPPLPPPTRQHGAEPGHQPVGNKHAVPQDEDVVPVSHEAFGSAPDKDQPDEGDWLSSAPAIAGAIGVGVVAGVVGTGLAVHAQRSRAESATEGLVVSTGEVPGPAEAEEGTGAEDGIPDPAGSAAGIPDPTGATPGGTGTVTAVGAGIPAVGDDGVVRVAPPGHSELASGSHSGGPHRSSAGADGAATIEADDDASPPPPPPGTTAWSSTPGTTTATATTTATTGPVGADGVNSRPHVDERRWFAEGGVAWREEAEVPPSVLGQDESDAGGA